ncbi:AI-2E family transporter [Roseomonas fluvialis]|uniref:AI-2E family transporter n=1 Tax=Roseomonas fluvialis TaxID=1750527 RepID=A0ABN6NYK0_9PROT|nr:AI-2E family transporter [Roseomonas fluvialis]BDG71503.1 AI-2E family transporter [Roseomonas fluvialis]
MNRIQGSVLVLLAVTAMLFVFAPAVPLLGFAGLLLAVALSVPALWLMRLTGCPRWVAVLGVVVCILALAGLAGLTAAAPLAEQAAALAEALPRSFAALRDSLAGSDSLRWVADRLTPADTPDLDAGMAATAAGATLGWIGNAVLVALVGVYLAVAPHDYAAGLRALLHPAVEREAAETLAECGQVLRGWLLGQGFAMLVTGLCTWVGLMLLGVPMAGVLAVIAALLGFIPNIGPVIAAVPAMLLAATVSPWLALWVALLFLVVQFIEGNVLTPLVQQQVADLPPAALLLAQVLMAGAFGLLGVALAAPLAAVGAVIVRRTYAEGWLGRPPTR